MGALSHVAYAAIDICREFKPETIEVALAT